MAKTIVGLYDHASTAQTVVGALEGAGFGEQHLRVFSHDGSMQSKYASQKNEMNPSYLTGRGVPDDEAQFYFEAVRRGGSLVVARVRDENADDVADVMEGHDPVRFEDRHDDYRASGFTGYDASASAFTDDEMRAERDRYASNASENTRRAGTTEGEERVQIVEENLKIGEREVERGSARLHTSVETEQVEETLRLREEHVRVDRRDVDRPATEAELAEAFQERTIEMRETAEEAVVEKEARVTGEVVIGKEVGEREQTVSDTVRRMRVDVDEMGGDGNGSGDDRAFRSHYDQNFASSGRSYESMVPAYSFGHEASSRYGGDYSGSESNMRSDYEGRYGSTGDSAWENVKDAVKHGFQGTRNAVTGGDDGNRGTHR